MKIILSGILVFIVFFTTITFTQSTVFQESIKDTIHIKHAIISSGTVIGSNNLNHQISSSGGQLAIDSVGNNLKSIYFGFWYQYPTLIMSDLDNIDLLLPKEFELKQNYPNPFNPATTIEYAVSTLGEISIEVFNVLGQRINVLLNKKQPPGFHKIIWNGYNSNGSPVTNGIYFYRMVAKTSKGRIFGKTKKMILLK